MVHAEDCERTQLSVIQNFKIRLLQIFYGLATGIADRDVDLNHPRISPQCDSRVFLSVKRCCHEQRQHDRRKCAFHHGQKPEDTRLTYDGQS